MCSVRGHFLPLCLLLHQLPEEDEEGDGGDSGSQDVADGLRQEDSHGLVLKEIRQNEDQGNQQDQLPQTRHKQADFCLAQSHEGLLTAHLEADGETPRQEDPHGPGGVADKGLVAGEEGS